MQRDVTGKGVRVRVAEYGQGEPVILLHGLFYDCTTWDRVGHDLRDNFRVITGARKLERATGIEPV